MAQKNKAEVIALLEEVADQMVREGCLNTTSGNWTFDYDELAALLPAADVEKYQDTLCDLLCGREEVAVAEVVHGRLDVGYHLAYCTTYEDIWGEMEPRHNKTEEKPSIMAQLAAHRHTASQAAKPPETAPEHDNEREI